MNIIARLEYELAYYDSAVHRFNHYTTRTPISYNGNHYTINSSPNEIYIIDGFTIVSAKKKQPSMRYKKLMHIFCYIFMDQYLYTTKILIFCVLVNITAKITQWDSYEPSLKMLLENKVISSLILQLNDDSMWSVFGLNIIKSWYNRNDNTSLSFFK